MSETLSVTVMLPNKFEPKRSYRWVLAIEGIDSFLVASTNRPSIQLGEKKIDFINSYRMIGGKLSFGDFYYQPSFLFLSTYLQAMHLHCQKNIVF